MQKKFQKAGLIKMNDLKLNKELYKYEDIILVTKVFSHLALIEVEEDNNYWKCKKCGYEENSETSAFCEKCGAISESKKSHPGSSSGYSTGRASIWTFTSRSPTPKTSGFIFSIWAA